MLSTVRRNLLEQPGYTPYCGAESCRLRMPRTVFNGQQFQCACGWQSSFEAKFIELYKLAWSKNAAGEADEPVEEQNRG